MPPHSGMYYFQYAVFSFFQHVIQQRTAYGPVVFRLACGVTANKPFGFWKFYGSIGMYKSN